VFGLGFGFRGEGWFRFCIWGSWFVEIRRNGEKGRWEMGVLKGKGRRVLE